MKEKKIFDALSEISEKYIEEARTTKLHKQARQWKKWVAIAASVLIVIGVSGIFAYRNHFNMGSSSGGGGHDESSTFMSYAGPVFPLTLSEADDTITASRNILYDFPLTGKENKRVWGAFVTDSYNLSNTSNEEKRIKFIYPFAGRFNELTNSMPKISVNGQEVSANLYAGRYVKQNAEVSESNFSVNRQNLNSWEDYKLLLEDGQYQNNAFTPYPVLSQQVTVYTFTDFEAPEEYQAATQAISFTIDPEKTMLLQYGFNGGEFGENGFRRYSYFVPNYVETDRKLKMLIVIGDDIKDYTLQGYKTGACEKGNELEGVSCTVIRTERILYDVIAELARDFFLVRLYDVNSITVPMDMLVGAISELVQYFLADYELYPFTTEMLEDLILEVYNQDRVFYLTFEIEIPAGESVIVTADIRKKPSYDFTCSDTKNKGIQGYDMVTRLGSNLCFSEMTAEIANTDFIEIVRQNFGFDKSKGITKVKLDPTVEHYFLEIRAVENVTK